MKRILGILAGASLTFVVGCAQQYDLRLETTVENKKYQQTLDKNLEKAPESSLPLFIKNVATAGASSAKSQWIRFRCRRKVHLATDIDTYADVLRPDRFHHLQPFPVAALARHPDDRALPRWAAN